jgi:hypothetical protein
MEYLRFLRHNFLRITVQYKHPFVHTVQFGYLQLIFRLRLRDSFSITNTSVKKHTFPLIAAMYETQAWN